jgi:hypothetical protein
VNIDNSSPAQALRTPLFSAVHWLDARRAECLYRHEESKIHCQFFGRTAQQMPTRLSHPAAGLDRFMILQCTIAVLAIPLREIVSMHFDRFALHRTHLAGGYS